MSISSIRGLYHYVKISSGLSGHTVHSVILSLGYYLWGSSKDFKELSGVLKDCSNKRADTGFSGFIDYNETITFFWQNRQGIVAHMEQSAANMGTDIISMVQSFGAFRKGGKPKPSEVGRALWDSREWPELENLYRVFALYALEEVAHTWNGYLEAHQTLAEKFPA